jgi:prephenate dehydrogenase
MKIGVIGLGLIGGSLARDLRSQIHVEVYGIDNNVEHQKKAIQLGLVDDIKDIFYAERECDVLILAVPVNAIESMLPEILDRIGQKILIDVGSTKSAICKSVQNHKNRGRYIAAHPLAGTEYSGPEAALKGLFQGKKNIICDQELTDEDALKTALDIFESVGLNTYFMTPEEHDKHLAYVSHLSHVSSFMLGLTVLDIEKDEKQIFNLASTGFESTVRLAKSNPKTWQAIFMKNKKYVSEALTSYIDLLTNFKEALDSSNEELLQKYMEEANAIKRILNKN